jgi:hypothetical protein
MALCLFGTWEMTRFYWGKFSLIRVESKGTFYSRFVREQGFRPKAAALPKFRKNIFCVLGGGGVSRLVV